MKQILVILILLVVFNAEAAIKLPQVLSSNMVLQRDGQTNIWGWATPGKKITIEFRGTKVSTKVLKDGKWSVKIATGQAGGPFNLVISETETITLTNILVGDVWICSGQSNMEFPLARAQNGAEEVKKADYPNIRMINVPNLASAIPVDDILPAEWKVCTPQTVGDFSAVGFLFGKEIHLETGVPIGLIGSNWGGTIVETWTSEQGCQSDNQMKEWVGQLKTVDLKALAIKQAAVFNQYQSELKKVNEPTFAHAYMKPDFDDGSWKTMPIPGAWEQNPGLESFDGIIWFRYEVMIPEGFKIQNAQISLAKIDDTDVTWINGKRVGETFNHWDQARVYTIPANVLHVGKNRIAVRVEDYSGGGGIYGLDSDLFLTDGKNKISLSGSWKWMKDETPTPSNPNVQASSTLQPNQFPTLLYNGMIHPLTPFAIKGALWYQGESNADAMQQTLRYEKQFKGMIADWRAKWNVGNFPFCFVQLANYKAETNVPRTENWPFLREAQANTLEVENTGMACIIDIGDGLDIHPLNKIDVAHRLALNALKFNYGKNVEYAGPRMADVKINGASALVTFNHADGGLVIHNKYEYITGFAVAGSDKVFHYAQARKVSANQVEVTCDVVEKIESVRFLWSDNPGEITLYNQVGLPAEPFRTDRW